MLACTADRDVGGRGYGFRAGLAFPLEMIENSPPSLRKA